MSFTLDPNYILDSPSRDFFFFCIQTNSMVHAGDSLLLLQTCYVSLLEQFIRQAKTDAKVTVVTLLPFAGNSKNYERIIV